jgi:hypothetical protein
MKTNPAVRHRHRAERKPTLSMPVPDRVGFHSALCLCLKAGLFFIQLYACAGQGLFSFISIPVQDRVGFCSAIYQARHRYIAERKPTLSCTGIELNENKPCPAHA